MISTVHHKIICIFYIGLSCPEHVEFHICVARVWRSRSDSTKDLLLLLQLEDHLTFKSGTLV